MAIRTMRLEKDEILRKKSREVDIIDDKIQTLIDDMIETMYKYNGVGLSAVQVGVLKRVVVIDIEDGEGARVFINPKITSTKGEHEVEEGCLSFPVAHEIDHLDGIVFIDRMIPGTLEYVDNSQN